MRNLLIILLSVMFISSFLIQCNNDKEVETTNAKMPRGYEDIKFGMSFEDLKKLLSKHSINLSEASMEGSELLIFILNITEDTALIQEINSYIASNKFGYDNPISKILTETKIYNITIEVGKSYGMMTSEWSPIEIYFYKNKLFGLSALLFDNPDGTNKYKEKLIDIYNKGNKRGQEIFSVIYEDDYTLFEINAANSLYLYDKKIYNDMIAYVKSTFELINKE